MFEFNNSALMITFNFETLPNALCTSTSSASIDVLIPIFALDGLWGYVALKILYQWAVAQQATQHKVAFKHCSPRNKKNDRHLYLVHHSSLYDSKATLDIALHGSSYLACNLLFSLSSCLMLPITLLTPPNSPPCDH